MPAVVACFGKAPDMFSLKLDTGVGCILSTPLKRLHTCEWHKCMFLARTCMWAHLEGTYHGQINKHLNPKDLFTISTTTFVLFVSAEDASAF